MTLEEMLKDLPTVCNRGSKKNSQGHVENCNGYKLHIDTADNGIPISALLTSASVYDSQVAIPLATITARRIQNRCIERMELCVGSRILRKIVVSYAAQLEKRDSGSFSACKAPTKEGFCNCLNLLID